MNTPVRVCPTCGERDEFPEYWTPKCEKDWSAESSGILRYRPSDTRKVSASAWLMERTKP